MGKANTKRKKGKALRIVNNQDSKELRAALVKNGQMLLPFLDLITQSRQAIDEMIDMAVRASIEALLLLSAEQVAGPKRQGQRKGAGGEVLWYGSQPGRVSLAERKLRVVRPRLRTRGQDGKEVEIPAYTALQDSSRLTSRIFEILMDGVSTRKYERVLPQMAETVGVAKSSVSAEFVDASSAQLKALMERRFDKVKLLVIYLDGIVIASHHVLAAVGVDESGTKHVLGLAEGASENQTVAISLLEDLVGRGVDAKESYLFVIDGSKALRVAIKQVFGQQQAVQRCRAHKMRNVIGHLPKDLQAQVQAVMRAAYKLPYSEGIAKLKKQAEWLAKQHPTAAASLLEGLEETFTVNKLGLTPKLMRALSTTNIIENPNGTARRSLNRVARWRDGQMVLRWAAATFLTAEKRFRRIGGHQELWVLKSALSNSSSQSNLDPKEASA